MMNSNNNSCNFIESSFAEVCSVYPQTLITLDEGEIPLVIFGHWALISGDYIDQTYAIFASTVQRGNTRKIAMKMYVADHEIEIIPNEFNTVVTVDGNTVDHKKGLMVPKDEPQSFVFK